MLHVPFPRPACYVVQMPADLCKFCIIVPNVYVLIDGGGFPCFNDRSTITGSGAMGDGRRKNGAQLHIIMQVPETSVEHSSHQHLSDVMCESATHELIG